MNGVHALEHPLGRFDPTKRSRLKAGGMRDAGMNALEAALKYAERGWYVYAPAAGANGDFTTNEARIRKHYKNPDANTDAVKINLAMSGLVALEFEEGVDLTPFGIPSGIETLRTTSPMLLFSAPKLMTLPTGKVASNAALLNVAYLPPTCGHTWANGFDELAPVPDPIKLIEARDQHKKEEARIRSEWPEPLDLVALSQRTPEPPKFIIDDWLPCGYATLFAGHGGVGKSGIALHLAVCIAAGLPFFGSPVAQRRVLYLSCEDRENHLHWRLARICSFLHIELARLAGQLGIIDLVGEPTVLWERDPYTGASFTGAHGNLNARIKASGSEVLVVDGIADTFGGNENARTEVKAYVNSLLALVPADAGAVLLVGHISKPSASNSTTSEGYSGSTGWHNSVRARWYLYPDKSTDTLRLELQKSNLGPSDRAMEFRWDAERHLFVGSAITEVKGQQRDEEERAGILAAMKGCPVPIPTASSGISTTFNVLSIRPEFPPTLTDSRGGKKRFLKHIQALHQMGAIAEGAITTTGRNRKSVWEVRDEKF